MDLLPTVVATPRLVLRTWTVDDVPALRDAVTASLDHLRPWMPWASSEPVADAERVEFVRRSESEHAAGGDVVFGVFLDGVVVGGTGLHRRRGPGVLEIGYWIHVDHVGRGYAGELAAALTTTAFDQPGIGRVEIHHDRANVASRRVPERLGYRFEGERPREIEAPGEDGVDCCWSIDPVSWAGRLDRAVGDARVGSATGPD